MLFKFPQISQNTFIVSFAFLLLCFIFLDEKLIWKVYDLISDINTGYYKFNQNYYKILERDWLSAAWFEH